MEETTNTASELLADRTTTLKTWLEGFLTWENLFKVIGAVVVLLILWIVYRLLLRSIKRSHSKKMTPHKQQLLMHFIKYTFYIILILEVLSLFGIKLSALLGAAGIAGVALGFAAQTSVSNLISGLFVLTEGSIKIGDAISVDGMTGVVSEINLLSIHVNTYDNEMVRIPNSTIINSNFKNISFHPYRRMTFSVTVSYETDMRTALNTLLTAPGLCETVLADPKPVAWFDGFGGYGINMTLAAYFYPKDFFQTKNDLYIAIKKVFDDSGIVIPINKIDVRFKDADGTDNNPLKPAPELYL